MLNFNFSEKGLGLVSPTHFVYHFSIKIILMLQSINGPNFIVFVLLHDQKSQDKNLNILRTKRAFEAKKKSIFHHL